VQEIDLAEPRAGEVLVRLVACGVCHTDLYTASGADPSGYAPTVLGHEGAGVVEKIGPDVSSLAVGDHVVTLFSPQCGKCVHCLSPKTNLCLAIRDMQGKGYLPDGTARLSRDGEPIRHFMGTSTFAEYTVMPEIALAKVSPERAGGERRAVCLRTLDRPRRRHEHREGGGRFDLRRVRRRHGRAGRRGWLPPAGAERIICVDMSEGRLELARVGGATETMIGGD
jgi:S-(hydroxymethyl)glutathione dehydrogenase/alcohol dehydrogenase